MLPFPYRFSSLLITFCYTNDRERCSLVRTRRQISSRSITCLLLSQPGTLSASYIHAYVSYSFVLGSCLMVFHPFFSYFSTLRTSIHVILCTFSMAPYTHRISCCTYPYRFHRIHSRVLFPHSSFFTHLSFAILCPYRLHIKDTRVLCALCNHEPSSRKENAMGIGATT
jgi:hypothetical protein